MCTNKANYDSDWSIELSFTAEEFYPSYAFTVPNTSRHSARLVYKYCI